MRLVVMTEDEKRFALNECHDNSETGNHHGVRGTRNRVIAGYYWPTLIKDVTEWVRSEPLQFKVQNSCKILHSFRAETSLYRCIHKIMTLFQIYCYLCMGYLVSTSSHWSLTPHKGSGKIVTSNAARNLEFLTSELKKNPLNSEIQEGVLHHITSYEQTYSLVR